MTPQNYSILFGKKTLTFALDSNLDVQEITPAVIPPAGDPLAEVIAALNHPLAFDWNSLKGVNRVAIAINDKTRPVPHQHLLPPLLEILHKAGLAPHQIKFFIATGTHLPMLAEEYEKILPPEILTEYSVESHDCDAESKLVYLGETRAGIPVWVNAAYYQADLKVVIGNIEPHHFMGFSGGNKSASIGLTGRKTIDRNHAMLLDDRCRLGAYDDNPMRQDVEEIGSMIGVHLAVNAILNDHKQIVRAFAGDPLAVMQPGIQVARSLCQVPVSGLFDLVIASAGGHPKDINLYQAQKALTNAALMTRDGGTVILVAACPEGVGSQGYVDFMQGVPSFPAAIEKFKQQSFKVGPHKAYQFAKIGSRLKIVLVSQLPTGLVQGLLLRPANDLPTCIAEEIARLGSSLRIAVLPAATNTLPFFN